MRFFTFLLRFVGLKFQSGLKLHILVDKMVLDFLQVVIKVLRNVIICA